MSGIVAGSASPISTQANADQVMALFTVLANPDLYKKRMKELAEAEQSAAEAMTAAQEMATRAASEHQAAQDSIREMELESSNLTNAVAAFNERVAAQSADLEARAANLTEREANASKRRTELERSEQALQEEVNERMAAVAQRETAINKREAAVVRREKSVEAKLAKVREIQMAGE